MKTNLLLLSAVLACASLSFAAGSGSSSTYSAGGSSTRNEGGTGTHPTKDGSNSIYDQTINPAQNQNPNTLDKKTRQGRVSTDTTQDTDRSGHKTDQAPTTQE